MAAYTIANLKSDVEDQAPKFGLSPDLEGHFARRELGLEQSGVSYQKLAPGFRVPFGHKHEKQEEIYVILAGSGRAKLDDDVVDLKAWDALAIQPGVWRAVEAGPDGIELIAFGARPGMPADSQDADMEQGWWKD
jgi:mannose-6-phosphate isomerase-like protein (cupin superfamily)